MRINLIEDLLVPGVVPLVDFLVSEKIPAAEPGKYADYTGLGMCLAGYGLSAFGIGGNYSKNIGIASLDWAVSAIRNLVRTTGKHTRVFEPAPQRLEMRPATRAAFPTFTAPVSRGMPIGQYAQEEEILA